MSGYITAKDAPDVVFPNAHPGIDEHISEKNTAALRENRDPGQAQNRANVRVLGPTNPGRVERA